MATKTAKTKHYKTVTKGHQCGTAEDQEDAKRIRSAINGATLMTPELEELICPSRHPEAPETPEPEEESEEKEPSGMNEDEVIEMLGELLGE